MGLVSIPGVYWMTRSKALDFFWSHVKVGGLEDCWEWIGHVSKYGYGTYNGLYDYLGTNRCHKQSYILTRGMVPRYQVLHSCDNRRCCNPAHLRDGTHSENMQDMLARGRESHHGVSQPGELNGSHKITAEPVVAIRKDTRTLKLISLDYGISKVRVSQIKRKLCWKHVKGEEDDE